MEILGSDHFQIWYTLCRFCSFSFENGIGEVGYPSSASLVFVSRISV